LNLQKDLALAHSETDSLKGDNSSINVNVYGYNQETYHNVELRVFPPL